MTYTKTKEELSIMKEGGKNLGRILDQLLEKAHEGVVLLDLEKLAQRLIKLSEGTPSFQTVAGYRFATCLCVNDVVVHGIPTAYALKDGDVLTIDIGLLYKGLHTDTAWTKIIQNPKSKIQNLDEKKKFLSVGEEALKNAIVQAKAGNRIGHISQVMQETVEKAGYNIVKTLVGHGVGKELHEAPQVPGFVRGSLENTLPLEEGMTLALEVIYAQGKGNVVYVNDDGWSIATADRSLSAVFEHTIAITNGEPMILTKMAK